jgi:predicted component of type VI protein secretion system
MSETLAERLRQITADDNDEADVLFDAADLIEELQDEIERLLRNAKADAQWLAAYHKWCQMNGCAPSSRDLSIARDALGEEKK